jgi:hypothetical protein
MGAIINHIRRDYPVYREIPGTFVCDGPTISILLVVNEVVTVQIFPEGSSTGLG